MSRTVGDICIPHRYRKGPDGGIGKSPLWKKKRRKPIVLELIKEDDMKGCPGIICCKDMYPLEPKYWCDDCLDNYFAEQEMKYEGDR